MSFVVRWLAAMFAVFATYNPSGYSYFHWVTDITGGQWAFKVGVGVALVIFYVIYFRATIRSIGVIGMGLTVSMLGASTWVLVDAGVLDLNAPAVLSTVMLVGLASLIAVGISWSHVRNRVSGQIDSDDITNPRQPLI
jgi:hypothetical protein